MFTKTRIAAVALFLFASGCNDSAPFDNNSTPFDLADQHSEPIQILASSEFGVPEGGIARPPLPGDYPDVSSEETAAKARLLAALSMNAAAEANSYENWSAADRSLRALLADSRDLELPEYVVEQVVASAMLRDSPILEGEVSSDPEKAEAIAFYTTLLVENNSPDASLIRKALRHLDSHWTAQRWSDAALSTAKARRSYDERVAQCAGCDPAAGYKQLPPEVAEPYIKAIDAYHDESLQAAAMLAQEARAKIATQ